jgi:hypothetical protein
MRRGADTFRAGAWAHVRLFDRVCAWFGLRGNAARKILTVHTRCALVGAALGIGMSQDVLAADLVVQGIKAIAGFGLPPSPIDYDGIRRHRKEFARNQSRKGLVIPDEAKASSAAMSAWIDSNRGMKRRKRGRKTAYKPTRSIAPQSTAPTKRSQKRTAETAAASTTPAQQNSVTGTPLRIPYGNKEVALKLGARYGSAGWYARPGVDLAAFGERGWL